MRSAERFPETELHFYSEKRVNSLILPEKLLVFITSKHNKKIMSVICRTPSSCDVFHRMQLT